MVMLADNGYDNRALSELYLPGYYLEKKQMEDYFKNIGCIRTNIEVFGPNVSGLKFYEKNGYVVRDMIVSKKL